MLDNTKKIGFIGAGNMASSIIRGIIQQGFPAQHVVVSNRSQEKLDALVAELGVTKAESNNAVVIAADMVVLAVKPQQHQEVITAIAADLREMQPLLITVAIAVSTQMMANWIGAPFALIRAMPNTPVQVGCGTTGLFANDAVTSTQKAWADSLFSGVGQTLWLHNEDQINSIAAVSGSGPAYLYYIIEAWTRAAIDQGFSPEEAQVLVMQTIQGANALLQASDADVVELRRRVTSPKGSTEAAIAVFAEHDMVGTFHDAMSVSVSRIEALQQQLENS